MAFENHLIKITWEFGLWADAVEQEIAEFSIWFRRDPADPPASWDAGLLDLATAASDAWSSNASGSRYHSSVKQKRVIAAEYNTTLHTAHEAVYVDSTPWVGSSSDKSLPWQMSNVCSLYTYTPGAFIPNGKRRRGRCYLPPYATTVLNDSDRGTLSTSVIDAELGIMNDIIGAVTTHEMSGTSSGQNPGVLSRVDETWREITDLAMDQVLDTQRRRTHSESRARRSVTFSV